MPDKNDSLALTVYVKRGVMIVLREALDVTDPESWPMKWKEKFGSVDGFPWTELYGKFADDARRTFFRKTGPKAYKYCPCCGEEVC